MLSCTLAFAATLGLGLGDAVTAVLAFAFVFEFSVVLQALPKTAKAKKVKRAVVRRMSFPPVCHKEVSNAGAKILNCRLYRKNTLNFLKA
jgi:hypothetical protein